MKRLLGALVVLLSIAFVPAASSGPTLDLKAMFVTRGLGISTCPAGLPASTNCYSQTAQAPVRGLGPTTLEDSLFVDQSEAGCEHLKLEGTLAARNEGTVSFTATSAQRCIQLHQPSAVDYAFVGGAGGFAGATGTGTIILAFVSTPSGDSMSYTWQGVLTVPGHSFDTTPPAFSGIRNKLVRVGKRAHRARVVYSVKASDDSDGAVPVDCRPRSGAWFRVGRTTVACRASDARANEARARFRVTVQRRR
jgi:HYR domain-containing protein